MSKFKVGDHILSKGDYHRASELSGQITSIGDHYYKVLWLSNGWPGHQTYHDTNYIDDYYNREIKVVKPTSDEIRGVPTYTPSDDCENISACIDCSDNLD